MFNKSAGRVLLGMSGGIDSSVSACILKEMGYEVVGITFNTLSPSAPNSNTQTFITDAQNLANEIGIEHHVLDVFQDFKEHVIDYFIHEYLNGRTPNPCIRCNETIKWKLLLEQSNKLNCQKIATGHYVNIVEIDGFYHIKKGTDSNKDQSYFLWNLSQDVLEKCLFPLGSKHKMEIKQKAKDLGFGKIADKKESMGVCFLQGADYRTYIDQCLPELKTRLNDGMIINLNGEVIGNHEGYPYYTIGQKRGLNLYKNHGDCVASIEPERNVLITAPKNKLYSNQLFIADFKVSNPSFLESSQEVSLRIRGIDAVPPTPGIVQLKDNKLHITFHEPVWAITPGQSIVFYKDDIVMGGGIVDKVTLN